MDGGDKAPHNPAFSVTISDVPANCGDADKVTVSDVRLFVYRNWLAVDRVMFSSGRTTTSFDPGAA